MNQNEPLNSKEATEGEELTPAQEKAVYALLTCRTFDEAALSAGVSRSTLQRWRALPAFAEAYQDKRLDLIAGTTNALRAAIPFRAASGAVIRACAVRGPLRP